MTAFDPRAVVLEWYEAHKDNLYWYLFALLRNHGDVEDVMQTAFIALAQKGEALRAVRHPKSYLYQLARYQAYKVITARTQHPAEALFPDTAAVEPFDGYITRECAEWALGLLEPQERELIIMRACDRMTFAEIARVTNCMLPTAATRYFRALKKLQLLVEDHHEST